MKAVARIALACTLSLGIALVMSYVQGSGADGDGGLPVFSHKGRPLTKDNVVDRLAPLALHVAIVHVEWREPLLAVDLRMDVDRAGQDDVLDDLLQLAKLGFGTAGNVDQLLVRVMMKDGATRDDKRLLLTMEARRDRFSGYEQKSGSRNKLEARTVLQSYATLTYTGWWKDRFGG